LALEEGDHFEVGDVKKVVAVELLLLVDRSGVGRPLGDTEPLFALVVPLDVALGSSIVLGQVSGEGLNPGERSVPSTVEDGLNPLGPTVVELDDASRGLGVREENIEGLDSVLEIGLGVLLDGRLKGASLLGIRENTLEGVV